MTDKGSLAHFSKVCVNVLFVIGQSGHGVKGVTAFRADKRLLVVVSSQVGPQRRSVRELSLAKFAFQFVAVLPLHVELVHGHADAHQLAEFALDLLPGVEGHVLVQFRLSFERFGTLGAFEGSLLHVSEPVPVQLTGRGESPATLVTLANFFRFFSQFMANVSFEESFQGECQLALGTAVYSDHIFLLLLFLLFLHFGFCTFMGEKNLRVALS